MMLPAVAMRFWARDISSMIGGAILIGIVAGYVGLLLSFIVADALPPPLSVTGAYQHCNLTGAKLLALNDLVRPGR